MALVTDTNRPQPLRQPPPTAGLTACGAASEVPALLMHPCQPPYPCGDTPSSKAAHVRTPESTHRHTPSALRAPPLPLALSPRPGPPKRWEGCRRHACACKGKVTPHGMTAGGGMDGFPETGPMAGACDPPPLPLITLLGGRGAVKGVVGCRTPSFLNTYAGVSQWRVASRPHSKMGEAVCCRRRGSLPKAQESTVRGKTGVPPPPPAAPHPRTLPPFCKIPAKGLEARYPILENPPPPLRAPFHSSAPPGGPPPSPLYPASSPQKLGPNFLPGFRPISKISTTPPPPPQTGALPPLTPSGNGQSCLPSALAALQPIYTRQTSPPSRVCNRP